MKSNGIKGKHFFLILAFAALVCFCGLQAVKAGSAPTASVRGIVKFEGTIPKTKPINMGADPICAKQHSTPAVTQEIVADSKGGLQNVIVFVAEGLSGTFDPPKQPVVIEQKGCMYQPHVLALRANQPLEIRNDDPTMHNVHPVPANNREWNKAEFPGSKVEEAFSREEIAIPVKCNVHPWMQSYIAVFKHPYFVVTGSNGSFDLSNLPPGTYTIEAWHEKLGTATQKVTLGANESKAIEFVFRPRPGT